MAKNPWNRYKFKKTLLPNGVRVITEDHPNAVAVSVGIFVAKGTRDEAPDESGLAHFVEHMVFKGTKTRSALDISRDMEEVGAEINAFTSRETTSFVAFGVPEHLDRYVEVLCDLVSRPTFKRDDVQMERDVVIQEIRASDDLLEDCVYDRHFEFAFAGTPLARPILGSIESIESMTRERALRFYKRQFVNQNLVVAAAGRVNHAELCDLVEKWHSSLKGSSPNRLPAGTHSETVEQRTFSKVIRRRAEQAHLLLGARSPGFRDHRRFDAMVLNGILGGGLTSRLYQEIRENRGLAYAVYSHLYSFVDAGTMLMYAATEPAKAPEALEVALQEIAKLRLKGFRKEELEISRSQVRAGTVLNSDDPDSRMQSIAINEIVFNKNRPIDEILEEFDRVKGDSVQALADEIFRSDTIGITLMGPLPEKPMLEFIEKQRAKLEARPRKKSRAGTSTTKSATTKSTRKLT